MTHKRRATVFLSLVMWALSVTGFWLAGELWLAYGLDWREVLEMPIGQAFILVVYLLAGLAFGLLGTLGVLWATKEQPNE